MPDSPLEKLHQRFRKRCYEDLAALRAAAAGGDPGAPAAFAVAIHRLSGMAGSFGYSALSRLAGVVDDRLSRGEQPGPDELARLEAELTRVAAD